MAEELENPVSVNCPHCGATLLWTTEYKYKPFCSERCRLIDLGDWLLEKHAIPDTTVAEDQDDTEP